MFRYRRRSTRSSRARIPPSSHPWGRAAAPNAPFALDLGERWREHTQRLAVDRCQRALDAAEPDRVAPGPDEAVQLERRPAEVELRVVGPEERLVVAALLREAGVAGRVLRQRFGARLEPTPPAPPL